MGFQPWDFGDDTHRTLTAVGSAVITTRGVVLN